MHVNRWHSRYCSGKFGQSSQTGRKWKCRPTIATEKVESYAARTSSSIDDYSDFSLDSMDGELSHFSFLMQQK